MLFFHCHHRLKVLALFVAVQILWLVADTLGTARGLAGTNAMDLFGEGGFALFILLWIVFVLASRPAGRVTNLLFFGLCGIFLATLQDFADEFYRFPDNSPITKALESVPATLGILVFSVGLLGWYREQQAFNQRLEKREKFYREHTSLDYITCLYNAGYMLQALNRELDIYQRSKRPLGLLLFDIDNFDGFNRRFGEREGDKLLQDCSELIAMNLRRGDLLCRFSGDRFIALLPDTHQAQASQLAAEINHSMASVAHKCGEHQETAHYTLSIGVASARPDDTADELIRRANQALFHAKRCGKNNCQMAG